MFLTLHRDPHRAEYFASREASPVFFDRATDCWIVANPRQCEALIQSRSLAVTDYSYAYESLARSLGQDFPNFLFAFKHIPLCQNGEAHRIARRRLAEIISRRRVALNEAIPKLVERYFGRLEPGAELDLMAAVVDPLVTELIGVLTEVPIADKDALATASIVFDRMLGLGKRRRIERDLGAIRSMIRARLGPDADDDEEGARFALCILGHDTLIGTLGESLFRIIDQNAGRRLSEIDYPAVPPETGVPFVERIVMEPLEVDGVRLAAGDRVRLMLQSLAYSNAAADRVKIFGIGIHACLGRPMSLDIWAKISAVLTGKPLFAEIVDHEMRTFDFVFTCPSKLVVRLRR